MGSPLRDFDEVLTRGSRRLWFVAVVAVVVVAAGPGIAAEQERVGPERCGECHKKEYKAWLLSSHSSLLTDGYDEYTTDEVEAIAEDLDVFDVESDGICDGCHFNTYRDVLDEEELTATDCEACHGPAAGWVDIHSSFGARDGKQVGSVEDESPEHRQKACSAVAPPGVAVTDPFDGGSVEPVLHLSSGA